MAMAQKKLTLKEKLALKNKNAAAPAAESKKETKVTKKTESKVTSLKDKMKNKKSTTAETTEKKKGRVRLPEGHKYDVPDNYKEEIASAYAEIETNFDEFKDHVDKFLEKANKSSVKPARANIQNIIVLGKALRKTLAEARGAVAIVKA